MFLLVTLGSAACFAQIVEEPANNAVVGVEEAVDETENAAVVTPVTKRYGYCSRQQMLQGMPEYVKAALQLKNLREQYEKEAYYNESDFRRQYTEYLNGQKDFPQAILMKRQRDLQMAMEKGIEFREEADSLLQQAEIDLFAPVNSRLDEAIRAVAAERGYDYVIDMDLGSYIYLNPALSEDITPFVEQKLREQK